jgi:DNA helicase II / ATP-dependent DNA helicase PcrA
VTTHPPEPGGSTAWEAADGLNASQRRAVEHEGSPLVVLAGPGTGKTRVITRRIAHVIRARGFEPESILAVTFTIKAAAELRERLAVLLGPSAAGGLRTHTFNGFGMGLLGRFGDLVGLPPSLSLIDAAQECRLIREVVAEHHLHVGHRGLGLDWLAERLRRVHERLGHSGLLPEECEAFAHENLRRARELDDDDKGRAARAAAETFLEDARAHVLCSAARLQRGWLTYSDQLVLPIRLLRSPGPAGAIVRAEGRAYVVDEFQDCNAGQIELLRLLAGPEFRRPHPDVCVVGDDDQSIFGFRDADDRAFQRFERAWPGAAEVRLEHNYRSAPEVVRVANSVIARAHARFAPDKAIIPAGPGEGVVVGVELAHEHEDGEAIAALIQEDRARGGETPPPWRRYAVLGRTNGDLDRIAAALAIESIPVDRFSPRTVLDESGVADVLAWARWLSAPRETSAARRVLARPPFALAGDAIADLEREYRAAARRAESGAGPDPGDYAAWLLAHPGAKAAAERFAGLRAEVGPLPASGGLWRIIERTDPAHAELLGERDRARRVQALVDLVRLAHDKQPRLREPGDLSALLDHLDELIRLRALGRDSAVDADEGEMVPDDPERAESGVQLMTAHAAKGLEFHTVFLPRLNPPNGYPKFTGDKREPLPDGLIESLDSRSPRQRDEDEERRLFYTACTRAQHRLVLLSRKNKGATTSVNFYQELTGPGGAPVDRTDVGTVLDRAAREGRRAARGAIQRVLGGAGGSDPARALREEARVRAARALEAGARGDDPDAARAELHAAFERLRAIHHADSTGTVPPWVEGPDADLRLVASRAAGEGGGTGGGARTPGLRPPLTLSYTEVHLYLECPRCYYLRFVQGLPEATSTRNKFGSVAHGVLHEFFDRWRRADAEGAPKPGPEDLLALGRRAWLGSLVRGVEADAYLGEQLDAQLLNALHRLHDPGSQILELERLIEFPLDAGGHTHTMRAKIDRVDLGPDGGVRIIDYKTGRPAERLLKPKPGDLQLGIYALAWGHHTGATPVGRAEYWLLATGERGVIDLAKLNSRAILGEIERAVEGMLAGRFERGVTCDGPCRLLG